MSDESTREGQRMGLLAIAVVCGVFWGGLIWLLGSVWR
jgi:uncharacterized membrane protein